MYGGQSTYIPLKVNQSGVIPVIFASSILAVPGPDRVGAREQLHRRPEVDQRQPGRAPELVLHPLLHDPHHLLRLLLHGDRVQSAATGRHHPQTGRVHPGHPARARDREVPRQGPQPDHAARVAVPRDGRDRSAARVRALEHQSIPLRGHRTAHHRRRRAGDDEADRQSADDAQLRRVPRLSARVHVARPAPAAARQAGSREGHPGDPPGGALRRRARLDRRDVPGRRARGDRSSGGSPSTTWTRASSFPTPSSSVWWTSCSARATAAMVDAGFVLDGFPRTLRQAQELDRVLGEHRLDRVIDLDVPTEVVLHRIAGPAGVRELRRHLPRRQSARGALGVRRCAVATCSSATTTPRNR